MFPAKFALASKGGHEVFPVKIFLEAAVDSKKIVCPAHDGEMIYESVLLPADRCNAIIAFQNRLAKSFLFRTFYQLLALDTLKLVRSTDYLPFRFGDVHFKAGADLKGLADEIRSSKKAAPDKSDARPYPPRGHVKGSDLKAVYSAVMAEQRGSMFRIAQALHKTGKLETGVEEWDVAVGVGEFLLEMEVTRLELENLLHMIAHRKWEQIRILFKHTLLFSQIERDKVETGRQFDINDHLDILRLSVALDYAQVAACDSKMKEIAKQTKLGELGCAVFSIREPEELRAFIEKL